ncbi:hypothetical protein [Aureimonas pseudogalii]|uniref:Fido domain-containing protein n=1 Tax=Aureimonas pseudogalii TaxID=1744844 RepID=A0A7W6H8I0_9HYPH|nr:hypothetical protein [Aureimonas pseudogalii]MBB4000533.1 hypothetical protein [Aureimonas pseudogalii]
MTHLWVTEAVRRSYALSGGRREPTTAELGAHRGLMMCRRLEPSNLIVLMSYVDPAATLRHDDAQEGDDDGARALLKLLALANAKLAAPHELMSLFTLAKPFTAGNGRCGRALWLWRAVQGNETELAAMMSAGMPFGPAAQDPVAERRTVWH